MKIFNNFLCAAIFVISFCFSGSAFAANKVYPLDSSYGIVANDLEWTCAVYAKDNDLLGVNYKGYITGKAKYLPISFDFFFKGLDWSSTHPTPPRIRLDGMKLLAYVKNFLANYAQKSCTIFSGLHTNISEDNSYAIVNGSYFDNTSIGRFAFYIKPSDITKNPPLNTECYCMFIKIPGELLDDQAMEHLFQETFYLITPLIMD